MKLSLAVASIITFFSLTLLAHGGHDQGNHPDLSLTHHLSFVKLQMHAHIAWTAKPTVGTANTLKIEWRSAQDHTLMEPHAQLEVVPWMPSMGHGSAPTRIQKSVDSSGTPLLGTYEVSNIYFTMGGDWQVLITLTTPEGESETQLIDLLFPMNGNHNH